MTVDGEFNGRMLGRQEGNIGMELTKVGAYQAYQMTLWVSVKFGDPGNG